MTRLLAGPWLGEFGWELMTWVPHLRSLGRDMIVVCKPGHEFLYSDFASTFEVYNTHEYGDMWYPKRFPTCKPHMPKEISQRYPGYTVYSPNKTRCVKRERVYSAYGSVQKKNGYDLVIHARHETKYNQENRNYPVKRYIKLLRILRQDRDVSVCSVGTKAYHIPGTEDRRFCDLSDLADIFASSRLALGTSSGPMHFASLCKCPHVVITYNKFERGIGGTNRLRYTRLWNPFKTPCVILDDHGWKPPIEVVEEAVRKFI